MPDGELVPLPPKPRKRKGFLFGATATTVIVLAGVIFLIANAMLPASGDADDKTVRIGVADASSEYWKPFTKLAADKGITVQLVNFSDYTQANPALSQGQIDLNSFQHLLFLANYNVSKQDNLTPVASTYIVPLSLYSKKHTDLAQIPAGGTIAIPNDPTNQARALLLLQSAKLITLRGGGNATSTPADIDRSASKVTVTPVDAAQTVTSLPSVDAAVANNNFALDADLDPTKALFSDDPKSKNAEPYINVLVAREQDKDNPVFRTLGEIYHDRAVVAETQRESKGTQLDVRRPRADLVRIMNRVEGVLRQNNH
ncbi:MetQ/NlpA family ABC transporter substrate-binding protein [Sciscionella sediminilitoris]|uniref:MetQ/NlpA family ABC transporter substrate-binding protein n=1 Tax=Sciscionella sediminilitoris TaxID=1445613 RepID=UPI0004DF35E7|nr:MetQ/NlpA family ABC transporter substrate-binding protein [Sciscionella sp. SE31]